MRVWVNGRLGICRVLRVVPDRGRAARRDRPGRPGAARDQALCAPRLRAWIGAQALCFFRGRFVRGAQALCAARDAEAFWGQRLCAKGGRSVGGIGFDVHEGSGGVIREQFPAHAAASTFCAHTFAERSQVIVRGHEAEL